MHTGASPPPAPGKAPSARTCGNRTSTHAALHLPSPEASRTPDQWTPPCLQRQEQGQEVTVAQPGGGLGRKARSGVGRSPARCPRSFISDKALVPFISSLAP